jgi:hypothetical protein
LTLPSYLRPKIVIKKWDGSTTYFTYDAFAPPASGARVLSCTVEDKELVAAPFRIVIEDSGGTLDPNVGNGNKVTISIGTTPGSLAGFVTGYVRQVEVARKDTHVKEITLHGFSSVVRLDERISNFYRIAARDANGVDPDPADTSMKCSEIFKDIFEDTDHLPIGQPTEPFTTGGVQDIGERLASIKEPFIEWKQIADRAAEASGSVYGIDASDVAFMRYPTLTHSGITIKGASSSMDVDAATGYFLGPWNYTDTIKKSDGFANRLYGRGGTQLQLDIDKFTDSASIECYTKDRAIQFTPKAPRLDALSFILSSTGTLLADVAGEIRLDDGNTPDGEVVGTFSIFKNLVQASATTIQRVNTSMYDNRLQVDKKYWLVIKKAGDASNHLKWHRDNGTSGVNAERSASTWAVSTSSYTLAHRTYFSRRVLAEASDQISIDRYGVIEAVVDAPWIIERQTMDTYLTSILQYSALQHRVYDVKKIYAPSTLINAGKLVRLVDTLSGVNADAEVVMSRYKFTSDENGLGTRFAEIQLQAYVR